MALLPQVLKASIMHKQRNTAIPILQEGYGNVLMPEIELVDIKDQTRRKRMKGHFSERMLDEIKDTLEAGEQVILFQNRRGFAPIVECTSVDIPHNVQIAM